MSPGLPKLFPEVSGLLSTPKFEAGILAGEPPSPIHGIETGWPLAFKYHRLESFRECQIHEPLLSQHPF